MNILPTIKKASLLIDNEEASNFGLMDKISNFTITKEIPSYFSFGTNLIESVYIKRNKF
jgi:hypothetical protein